MAFMQPIGLRIACGMQIIVWTFL